MKEVNYWSYVLAALGVGCIAIVIGFIWFIANIAGIVRDLIGGIIGYFAKYL